MTTRRDGFMLALILLTCVACLEASDSAASLLTQADEHYAMREDSEEAEKAAALYERILNLDPSVYEAAWKLAKTRWYQGNFEHPDRKKSYFEKGIEAGKAAVSIDPTGCLGHFWLGVNYALYAESAGIFEALGLIDTVKEQMKKTIDIDPDCECGGPQRVLGKLYSRIPFFKGGSKKKAVSYLKESLERCPQDTQSRIFLAEVYSDDGQKGLAIQQLKLVLKQEPDHAWLPETKANKELAEKMLAGLESRKSD